MKQERTITAKQLWQQSLAGIWLIIGMAIMALIYERNFHTMEPLEIVPIEIESRLNR